MPASDPSPTSSATDVVRATFEAYLAQDREAIDQLLSDELTFTSPQDDHIDKTTYLERCFPTVDRLESQRVLDLVAGHGEGVFLMYEYVLKTGERHRNAEYITVHDDKVVDIQVFFGGKV